MSTHDGSDSDFFKVGETIECQIHTHRRDQKSGIKPGDHVKVTQTFTFTHEGRQCQDITVQRGNEMPIAVLVAPGRFRRLPSNPNDQSQRTPQ